MNIDTEVKMGDLKVAWIRGGSDPINFKSNGKFNLKIANAQMGRFKGCSRVLQGCPEKLDEKTKGMGTNNQIKHYY